MKQYYKVINTKDGHHGYLYKVGLNVDPLAIRPVDYVGSCEPGAFYFTTAEYLAKWANYGDSIAWIETKSRTIRDQQWSPAKWKAQKINVTKILKFKDALPLIPEIPLREYESFHIHLTVKKVMEMTHFSLENRFAYIREHGGSVKQLLEFVIANPTDEMLEILEERTWFSWNVKEVEILLQKKLYKFITPRTIEELSRKRKNKKLMLEIQKHAPEAVIEALLKY